MRTKIEVTVHGRREKRELRGRAGSVWVPDPNGEEYSDTFVLEPEQYNLILELLQQEIDRRQVRTGHASRMYVRADGTPADPKYKERFDMLVETLVRMDF
jgi:hypothetical protein